MAELTGTILGFFKVTRVGKSSSSANATDIQHLSRICDRLCTV